MRKRGRGARYGDKEAAGESRLTRRTLVDMEDGDDESRSGGAKPRKVGKRFEFKDSGSFHLTCSPHEHSHR